MSHVFPRNMKNAPPVAVGGQGCYLFDSDGKQYFDGSGGAAVSCLGHGDPTIIAAVQDQVEELAFAHTGFFTSEPAEQLADLLIGNAPGGLGNGSANDLDRKLDRVYLVSGGSEATEAALKLARQYHVERGEPDRRHVIARRQSYHRNTLGALAAGGNVWRRQQFAPLLIDVHHIAPCYEYAKKSDAETSYEYGQRVAQELEDEILRLGPENVMAFMAEPVVGATLGAVPPVEGYFKRIREICDRYSVLLILDEVMCGMGRSGHLFAYEAEGITPDILCIAKGLGAGYQPIGAMICTRNIYEVIEHGSGFFQHDHTYVGHPVACAAGLAVLSSIIDRGLAQRAKYMGAMLHDALTKALGQHPNVGDIRGRGLFLGVELVADRGSKTPFDPSLKIAAKVKAAAFEAGLICYPMAGTRDGFSGDHELLAPPFILEEKHIGEITEKLSKALNTAL
jgi:adenosylmethionine-8-amino-7-oxononanoate aminotransferase